MQKPQTNRYHLIIICVIATTLFSVEVFAQTKENSAKFTVSGTLEGLEEPYMFIDYSDANGDRVWDTLFVKNNSFKYSANLEHTKSIAIWPYVASMTQEDYKDREVYNQKMQRVTFFAKPGEHVIYKGNVDGFDFNAIPTGTALNNDFVKYENSLKGIASPSKGQQANPAYQEAQFNFIKTHPKSEVSAYLLANMVQGKSITDEIAKGLLGSMDKSLMTSPFYMVTATRLKGADATKPGNLVPEIITTSTLDGAEFNLQSLRGKHVLIDFWGTWCGPCINEMPKVKEYKEKYTGKLVVLAIDSGDTKEQVIQFTTKNGYDWMQILSKKTGGEDDFVSKFNVHGFPTKFIIDPNGKILHKFVGNAEEAFVKLDEILGE